MQKLLPKVKDGVIVDENNDNDIKTLLRRQQREKLRMSNQW